MNRKGLVGTIAAAVFAIALAVILVACYFITKYFVVEDWQLFPRNQEQLDLRSQAISPESFDTLVWKMPGTRILWSVPLQSGYYDCTIQELTITSLKESDLDMLVYFPQLKTINAQGCTDYAALKALYERYPDIDVRYTVPIAGTDYAQDTETVTLRTLSREDMQLLSYLPNLTRVDGTACREFALLRELEQAHPEWEVEYLTSIAGTEITSTAQTLELVGATYEELSVGLAALPELKVLTLHNPKATGAELLALREEYADIEIHWNVEIFGNTYAEDVTELDISNGAVGSIEKAKEIAAKFPDLEKIIVDSTGIRDDDMSAYREEMRSEYKVVWTVVFTDKCKSRTDATYFFPSSQQEGRFNEECVYGLRFLEELECIDIGHMQIKTVDFASYMPNLKYLILADTAVEDITPLSTCKNLVYLELDHDVIHDYTPLLGCTALEDLNLNDPNWPVSIEPIKQMTWLKNLWVPTRSYADKQALIEALPNTRVVTSDPPTTFRGSTERCTDGLGWRNLKNYYDMRDILNEGTGGWLDTLDKRYMK